MCGICGFYSRAAHIERSELVRMTETLIHRGPDNYGYYYNPPVGLGHRRLSIIDLSENGRQPITNEDQTIQVIFNGEIYNFLDIRSELIKLGHQFKSVSDSEVIVHAYEQWGSQCFPKFNGMFAIAIWDTINHELVLCRDRFGKKPLFYYWGGEIFLFGSELKALLSLKYFRKKISLKGLQLYLQYGYIPAPDTIFEKTYKLPAGAYLKFKNGHISIERYWSLQNRIDYSLTESEILEKADRLLTASVKRRLISDVPLGFFLSGGTDSTIITAIAAQITSDVKTFTIGVDDGAYNEAGFAKEVANYLGTQHAEYFVTERDFLDFIPEAVIYFDEPFADSSLLPSYYVSKLTRQSVTVALSGDGGDELFGGYPKYKQLKFAQYLKFLPQTFRKSIFGLTKQCSGDVIQKASEALQFNNIEELMIWLSSIWKPTELSALLTFSPIPDSVKLFRTNFGIDAEKDPILKMMRIDLKMYMCEDILVKVDRASMANSLETRAPLLDHEFVEFINSIPLKIRLQHNQEKFLIKNLLSNYVPEELWNRPKMGFSIPVSEWLRKDLYDFFYDHVNRDSIRKIGFLNWDVLSKFIEAHMSKKRHFPQKLFSILMFCLWHDKYI